jgi:transcriptional regulator with XRE-family HTH domain
MFPWSRNLHGRELRELRRKRGDSIYAVARAIGVSPVSVSRWETGSRRMRPAFAKLLSLYFQGKLTDLNARGSNSRKRSGKQKPVVAMRRVLIHEQGVRGGSVGAFLEGRTKA